MQSARVCWWFGAGKCLINCKSTKKSTKAALISQGDTCFTDPLALEEVTNLCLRLRLRVLLFVWKGRVKHGVSGDDMERSADHIKRSGATLDADTDTSIDTDSSEKHTSMQHWIVVAQTQEDSEGAADSSGGGQNNSSLNKTSHSVVDTHSP